MEELPLDQLENQFQYVKTCREIDECNDIELMRNMLKNFTKLHLREKEISQKLAMMFK